MRISSDGFLNFQDDKTVRTPGIYEERLEPLPEAEALSFLLSHSFPGPRRIVRPLSLQHRSTLQRAMWADSVNERMSLVDHVWRSITEPMNVAVRDEEQAQLLQIVLYGDDWAYPLYMKNGTVRILPQGGLPVPELKKRRGTPRIDLQSAG